MDAGEHAPQRRLARAGGADDDEPLAGRDLQVNVVQDVVAGAVGVGDPPHPRRLGQDPPARGRPVRFDEFDADDARQGHGGGLEGVEPEGDLVDRLAQLDGVQGHRRHPADGDRAAPHQPGAQGQDGDERQADGQGQDADEHAPQPQGVLLGEPGLPQGAVEDLVAAPAQALGVDRVRLLGGFGDDPVELRPQAVRRLVTGHHA